jgi:2-haloalkanoic acid dehalogenase type II
LANNGPIKAIIFDYYETLAQLPRDGRERMMDAVAKAVGYKSEPGQAYREWFERTSDSKLRFAASHSVRPAVDGDAPPFRRFYDVWFERFGQLFRSWGVDADPAVGADAYTEHHVGAMVYPEVKDTLRDLGQTVEVAILSNADDAFLRPSVERNELEVATVISSEELKSYKPHVSMFRQACERLGIAPEDALYVGDQAWADVQGSRNAGMGQAWINRHGADWPEDVEPPQHTITSLSDLLQMVR